MLRPLTAAALLLALAGCDSGVSEAQRAFNDQGFFGAASGITRVTAGGETLSRDPDDWRVGPAFGTAVLSVFFDGPNPVRDNQEASITLDLTRGLGSGVTLFYRDTRGDYIPVPQLAPVDVSGPGFPTFRVAGSDLSPLGRPGVFRVLLLDGRDNVVTYGDIEVAG